MHNPFMPASSMELGTLTLKSDKVSLFGAATRYWVVHLTDEDDKDATWFVTDGEIKKWTRRSCHRDDLTADVEPGDLVKVENTAWAFGACKHYYYMSVDRYDGPQTWLMTSFEIGRVMDRSQKLIEQGA